MKSSKIDKVTAIIQTSYNSDLFSSKSLVEINGLTVLNHINSRIKRVRSIADVIVETPTSPLNADLLNECRQLELEVKPRDEDVLGYFVTVVKQTKNQHLLIISGNYPLIDPEMAQALIVEHIAGGYDLSFNEHYFGIPYGLGCIVINTDFLLSESKKNLTRNKRNAGMLYFLQNQHQYNTFKFEYDDSRPNIKLCLENDEDHKLIDSIFSHIKVPRIESIISFLDDHPLIAQSNKAKTISEVGLEKIALFPDKIKEIKEVRIDSPDFSYPISVELSLTNRCNLNCVWCSDKDLRDRSNGEIKFEILESLVNDLRQGGTKGIVIEGGGEPTIYKRFSEVVFAIKKAGMACGLITNGTQKIDPEIVAGFDWIRVSLDASSEIEFAELKGKDLLEKVLSNIKEYTAVCPTVGVGYVVTSKNCNDLDALVLRLRDKGVNYIQFRPVIDHPELLPEIQIDYLRRYSIPDSFNIITDGFQENIVMGNYNLPCKSHSTTTVISADGGVYICGRLNKYPWLKPIGNINKNIFHDIWNSQERVDQANMLLDKDFCSKHCPECRITKFNIFFNRVEQLKTTQFI